MSTSLSLSSISPLQSHVVVRPLYSIIFTFISRPTLTGLYLFSKFFCWSSTNLDITLIFILPLIFIEISKVFQNYTYFTYMTLFSLFLFIINPPTLIRPHLPFVLQTASLWDKFPLHFSKLTRSFLQYLPQIL